MDLYLIYFLTIFKLKERHEFDEYFRIEFKKSYRSSELSDFYKYIRW